MNLHSELNWSVDNASREAVRKVTLFMNLRRADIPNHRRKAICVKCFVVVVFFMCVHACVFKNPSML